MEQYLIHMTNFRYISLAIRAVSVVDHDWIWTMCCFRSKFAMIFGKKTCRMTSMTHIGMNGTQFWRRMCRLFSASHQNAFSWLVNTWMLWDNVELLCTIHMNPSSSSLPKSKSITHFWQWLLLRISQLGFLLFVFVSYRTRIDDAFSFASRGLLTMLMDEKKLIPRLRYCFSDCDICAFS